MSRPRGTIGDLRRTLRDVTYRLVTEQGLPGVTWLDAVQASGLSLGRSERSLARRTMLNLASAGELERKGTAPARGRPMTLYAPAQTSAAAAPAIDAVMRTWCGPGPRQRG